MKACLGPDHDIAPHFTPKYRPWRQRIAFVPDGDIFRNVIDGKASVVTDEIERLTVERASSSVINTVAVEQGMRTLRVDGLLKAAQGVTSLDEIFRVVT